MTPERTYISIEGTIIQRTGHGKYRQPYPKRRGQQRRIALPDFAAVAIAARIAVTAAQGGDALLFQTKTGNCFAVTEMGHRLRRFTDANRHDSRVRWERFTAYTYRKTTATTVNDEAGLDLTQELLGHANPATTKRSYVAQRPEVPARTAEILESRFGLGHPVRE